MDWHTFLKYMHSVGHTLLGEQILASTTFLIISLHCSIQSAGLPCQHPAYTVDSQEAEEDKAHLLRIHLDFSFLLLHLVTPLRVMWTENKHIVCHTKLQQGVVH